MKPAIKYCIIGAGPAGLTSAVALKQKGIDFDILDKSPSIGGIWDINRDDTPMYNSAHFISSKKMSGFIEFPMPESYPDYPRHDKILDYIQSYAKHHGLDEKTQLNTGVTSARPISNGTQWEVTIESGEVLVYDGLVCATGMNGIPNLPVIGGNFTGEIYHSKNYKDFDQFKDKRVLIIGAGNSGCDIACDAAQVAKRAYISMRRGYYFVPKYLFGIPADVYAHQGPKIPLWIERKLFTFLLNKIIIGNLEKYGLQKPDHGLLESHPILNTQILHFLGHGDLTAKVDVERFENKTVHFKDGTKEEVDLVLLATGYKRSYPFLDEEVLDRNERGVIDTYLEIFSRKFDNLFFPGCIETDGAGYELMGRQADLIAAFIASGDSRRAAFRQKKAVEHPDLRGSANYIDTPRHNHYVQFEQYFKVMRKAMQDLR